MQWRIMGGFQQVRYSVGILVLFIGLLGEVSYSSAQSRSFQLPPEISSADYLPGEIVLKIRNSPSTSSARTLRSESQVLQQVRNIAHTGQLTPILSRPHSVSVLARQEPKAQIYRIHTNRDVIATINELLQLDEVVYAEPYYLLQPLNEYIPNDAEAAEGGRQDYLEAIQAYEAWAIERSHSDMLIGYLDTGVEFGHEDLTDNLYRNEADPINGIDDDNDGYIDNYVGWDFADNDNDPTADANPHGTLVAGVGSASADNEVGVTGLGFNASYMPIKIFRSANNMFGFGYQAIAYAADRGCKVINLSWGGVNAYSQFGQDIINYAVLEKDAVVIAAAGNSGKQENYYPASFDNVLSVAMSDNNGDRVSQTTSSYFVDLLAPGSSNYTTRNEDSYGIGSGSSLSAPVVAGIAALVRSKYPELNALQVMEILRLTSKDVSGQSSNQGYSETLGRGLVQAAQALKPLNSPALRMADFSYQNNAGEHAYYDDTLTISVDIQNLLSATTANTQITLTSVSDYVTVIDSVFQPGVIDSLATVSNTLQPFRIVLAEDLPANEQLYFRLGFEDATYQDYQYFFIVSSSGYPIVTKNELQITVGSEGRIAYDPTGMSVDGIRYQDEIIATQAGLLVGIDTMHVSDNLINNFSNVSQEQDFREEESIRYTEASVSALQLSSAFTDDNATQPLNLRIEQNWLSDTTTHGNYIVSEYRVVNRSDSALSDVSVGLFADWNIEDTEKNRTDWDGAYSLAYTYNSAENTYAGIALLTDQTVNHQPLDLLDLNGNSVDVEEEVSEAEKYTWASSGIVSEQAGANGVGNDVAQILSATVDSILSNQGANIAFAWVAGNSLADLQSSVAQAQQFYASYRNNPELLTTVLVCTDSTATVQLADTHRFYQDAWGDSLIAEGTDLVIPGVAQDTVIYAATLADGYEGRIQEIQISIHEPIADFSVVDSLNHGWRSDTLFLDETDNHLLTFRDNSLNAIAWEWDFGNGYKSTQQHPQTSYFELGIYTIELTVTSSPGCQATYSQPVVVVQRAELPQFENQLICGGESVVLEATNSDLIKVYADQDLLNLLYEGEQFVTKAIKESTTFYVVNAAEAYDSRPQPVLVEVWQPELQIQYTLDTSDIASKYRLAIEVEGDTSNLGQYLWYVNDSLVSQQLSFVHDFSYLAEENWQLRLAYTVDSADLNCSYTLEETIIRTQAKKPSLKTQRICRGEAVTLTPGNGEVFYFYQDASLTTPLHAGGNLVLDSVAMNTTIYVTNLDGLIESEAIAVDVEINRFADFKTLTDTIYLSEPTMAVFQAFALDETENEISWQWDLGDGNFTHQAARINPEFDSAGIYSVRLLATRSDGCTNLVNKTIVVRNVASTRVDPEDQALKIYPNPVKDIFFLENLMWFQKDITLSLLSLDGQIIFHQSLFYEEFPLPIDLSILNQPLSPGIYVLRLQRDDKVFQRKLVIE